MIVGNIGEGDTDAFIDKIRSYYLPNTVVIVKQGGHQGEELGKLIPFIKEMKRVEGKTTLYVCQDYACKSPTTNMNDLEEILHQHLKKFD